MGKRQIIEALQMSIRIANDAVNSLKLINENQQKEKAELKQEISHLENKIDDEVELNNSACSDNEVLSKKLADSIQEITRLKEENENLKIDGTDFKKPRTYFDVASSEREFKVGEVVHVLSTEKGISFSKTIHANNTNVGYENYPLLIDGYTLVSNGKDHEDDELRRLFTTAEMIEMGYTIPDVE